MKIKKGKIVTVFSTKGGVGKTTTTLNLAYAYQSLGKKVLVLDFDLYGGNIATYLNAGCTKTMYHLALDLANNRYEALKDYIFNISSNIDIIASPKDPREANKIGAKYISLILRNAIYQYDVVLIDTTHILNDITILTLDDSDSICYLLTNDLFDLKNSKSFFAIMKDINYENIVVLLNESIAPSRNYFSLYDIRNMVKRNVDYTISKNMYLKNIDEYLMEGNFLLDNKKVPLSYRKELEHFKTIAKKLIGEEAKK